MITLKPYQQAAAGNTLDIFRYVATQIRQVDKLVERRAIVSHNGGVLLKAPTGSGKTLIAGEVVCALSREEKVVWFWFAPFKGLVGQTESSIRDKFPTLRVRSLKSDRQSVGTRSGDLWVSTWQSVAARDTEARKIRSDREDNPSLDTLLPRLREMGFLIGVVVDEAHHGFGHGTQALEYYSQHLCPDFTLLLTATPDDADAEAFKRAAGFQRLHPVTISRADAVHAGLVKPSVRSIAFMAAPDQEPLVDFETTAIREGTRMHLTVKAGLKAAGIDLVPLMLVQVDSSKDSVERVKKKLLEIGFTEDHIATHTADEPDANLLALAVDETKEVLIFKMAVALGFDAPRAFTLVSMRGIADADFGTQIVGRIMRVHRRCQGIARNFRLSEEILMDGMRHAVSVIKVDQAVFVNDETRTRIDAEVAVRETEILAQRMLFNMGTVDPRELQSGLLERLGNEYRQRGLEIADNEDQLDYALALILVQHPKLLNEARKACEASYTEVVSTAPLPDRVVSESPLDRLPKNIYGIYPSDLNTWERPFAEWLDSAEDGRVLWWHRNPPNKPWSVAVTLANGSQFFPDFVIAIPERNTPDSILLADTKRAINDDANALIKAVSDHKSYGRTAILFYEDEKRWKLVRYNEEKDKNEIAEIFDLQIAKDF